MGVLEFQGKNRNQTAHRAVLQRTSTFAGCFPSVMQNESLSKLSFQNYLILNFQVY